MSATQLPALTRDCNEANRDIADHGYALMADSLTERQVEAMRNRLFEQAACEAEMAGAPCSSDGEMAAGQVMSLLNKGQVWQDLLDPSSRVHQVVDHVFTPSFDEDLARLQGLEQRFLISSLGAGFKRRERPYPPAFHTDQAFAPGYLSFPIILNVFYLLSDFNYDNGATLVIPGSHNTPPPQWGHYSDNGALPIQAPAGTALIFEGRTWHAAGINTSGELRINATTTYVAPYIRQRELLAMNLRQDVVEQLSDEQLKMCGFDTMYQGPAGAFIGFNLIEPTLGRTNLSHRMQSVGELHTRIS